MVSLLLSVRELHVQFLPFPALVCSVHHGLLRRCDLYHRVTSCQAKPLRKVNTFGSTSNFAQQKQGFSCVRLTVDVERTHALYRSSGLAS